MPLAIYCYDKITGWKYVRTVSKDEASKAARSASRRARHNLRRSREETESSTQTNPH